MVRRRVPAPVLAGQRWLKRLVADGTLGRLAFATPAATLVFRDSPANAGFPCRWFVRSTPYACAGPAPFFAASVPVPAAGGLTLG